MGWGTNEKLNEIDAKVDQIQRSVNGLTQIDETEYKQSKLAFEKLVKDVEEIKTNVNKILSILENMQPGPAVGFVATVSKP